MSGDIATCWEDMKAQISAGKIFQSAGFHIEQWTMVVSALKKDMKNAPEDSKDKDEWRELNIHWHQFGTFVPLFSKHCQFPYRELGNIAPETHPAYKTMLYYTQLRYRLMSYIYTIAGMSHFNDFTIMRALMMDFESD